MKQRIYGIVLILVCIFLMVLSCGYTVPGDQDDMTAVLLLLPFGVYMVFTKQNVMHKEKTAAATTNSNRRADGKTSSKKYPNHTTNPKK